MFTSGITLALIALQESTTKPNSIGHRPPFRGLRAFRGSSSPPAMTGDSTTEGTDATERESKEQSTWDHLGPRPFGALFRVPLSRRSPRPAILWLLGVLGDLGGSPPPELGLFAAASDLKSSAETIAHEELTIGLRLALIAACNNDDTHLASD